MSTSAPPTDAPKADPTNTPPTTALELRANDGTLITYDYGEHAGVGSSNLPTSGFLPFLSVLQPTSKALVETHEKFVPGAKAGMFLLGGDDQKLYDGKAGLIFVPLHDRHIIVEKEKLDGTGKIIAQHDGDPKGTVATAMRNKFGNEKQKWRSDAGNFMVERHNVTGVLFLSVEDVAAFKPIGVCVVGFERSKMRAFDRLSKGFNKYEPRKRPPLFALMTKLTVEPDKDTAGHDFSNLTLSFPIQDDFARSLIPPTAPGFKDWAKQCSEVISAISTGKLEAKEGETSDDAKDDGGKQKDIPF